jgi:hypothetical protein
MRLKGDVIVKVVCDDSLMAEQRTFIAQGASFPASIISPAMPFGRRTTGGPQRP